jgi:hypothetical protein
MAMGEEEEEGKRSNARGRLLGEIIRRERGIKEEKERERERDFRQED